MILDNRWLVHDGIDSSPRTYSPLDGRNDMISRTVPFMLALGEGGVWQESLWVSFSLVWCWQPISLLGTRNRVRARWAGTRADGSNAEISALWGLPPGL